MLFCFGEGKKKKQFKTPTWHKWFFAFWFHPQARSASNFPSKPPGKRAPSVCPHFSAFPANPMSTWFSTLSSVNLDSCTRRHFSALLSVPFLSSGFCSMPQPKTWLSKLFLPSLMSASAVGPWAYRQLFPAWGQCSVFVKQRNECTIERNREWIGSRNLLYNTDSILNCVVLCTSKFVKRVDLKLLVLNIHTQTHVHTHIQTKYALMSRHISCPHDAAVLKPQPGMVL